MGSHPLSLPRIRCKNGVVFELLHTIAVCVHLRKVKLPNRALANRVAQPCHISRVALELLENFGAVSVSLTQECILLLSPCTINFITLKGMV